jgi:hypothetical protein
LQVEQEYNRWKREVEAQKQGGFHFEFNDHSLPTTDNRLFLGVAFYSAIPVIVDRSTFNHDGITLLELLQYRPDVLIIDTAWHYPEVGWDNEYA